jgi:hypothetical protein
MFRQSSGRGWAVIALGVLLGQAGCNNLTSELIVMPDGSGKMMYTIVPPKDQHAFTEADARNLKQFLDKEAFKDEGLFEWWERGIVGISDVELVKVEGKTCVRIAAYLDDVNAYVPRAIRVRDPAHLDPTTYRPFRFKALEDGFVLEVFVSGVDAGASFTLPGEIRTAEGAEVVEGRTVRFADVPPKQPVVKIICGPSRLSREEVAAFQRELDSARAPWQKRLIPLAEAKLQSAEKLIDDHPTDAARILAQVAKMFQDMKPAEEVRALLPQLRKRVAAGLLEAAKGQIEPNPLGACETLQHILSGYAETEAAKEARTLLPQFRERVAAELLKTARGQIEPNPRGAREALRRILNDYTETKAAEEARELLDTIPHAIREERAAYLLRLAEVLLRRDPRAAEARLQEIVREFSDTSSAEKARQLFASLGPARERAAGVLLEEARKLMASDPRAAEKALRKAIAEYSGTGAGQEARKLLPTVAAAVQEQRATGLLRQAEMLLPRNPAAARARLEEIIAKYPDTESAETARRRLKASFH